MFQSPSLRGSGRFGRRRTERTEDRRVSIPFIAGQWSLLDFRAIAALATWLFQSPSLRGSGRFFRIWKRPPMRRRVSIPFIAGQWSLPSMRPPESGSGGRFQSPSLRGSGRFALLALHVQHAALQVSIPFIAGQWSLRAAGAARPARRAAGFNPLHCGAVVASTMEVVWIASAAPGFNPLHCGAVVASRKRRRGRLRRSVFQSPSLRGSGRFRSASSSPSATPTRFQSPSLRGSGRFSMTTRSNRSARGCFNPLHCGAVVASGRAGRPPRPPDRPFQSPSLRGSGRFSSGSSVWRPVDHLVSIPFIAGQWSLLVPA